MTPPWPTVQSRSVRQGIVIYGNIYDKNKALKKGVLHKPFRAVRKTRGATMLFDYLGSETTATQNQLLIMF